MLSDAPHRWLVRAEVAAIGLDQEGFGEFGRDALSPTIYSGDSTGGTIAGGQHTLTFVLPPDTPNPGQVVADAIETGAQRARWTRFAIRLVAAPEARRFSEPIAHLD